MNGDVAMPYPEVEPEEIEIQFEIAVFEAKFAIPAGFDYSIDNLTEIRNLYIIPHFIKASNQLSRELGDLFEIHVVKISEGSLSIKGVVKATVKVATDLSKNALTAGVLASTLTIGVATGIEQNKNETLYRDTIQKIELILKYDADSLKFCPNPLKVRRSPLYSPALQKYKMIEFTFCPSTHKSLVDKVEKTLDSYHNKIGKI